MLTTLVKGTAPFSVLMSSSLVLESTVTLFTLAAISGVRDGTAWRHWWL